MSKPEPATSSSPSSLAKPPLSKEQFTKEYLKQMKKVEDALRKYKAGVRKMEAIDKKMKGRELEVFCEPAVSTVRKAKKN
ncbi:hypothetical protein CAEBREN_21274 [Caenorhabditis brenneri]|uniref:Uncharacterized protein n=1 Tax=Caenorhabditis brenneri TaxID=135651 RepID=G0N2I2_CAEBE|nr:hypothetical protein CAEBREN_21274 [Caenorhabditis brenneri]